MVFAFILIIIGLAMVSMCWNLVQMKLHNLVESLTQKIDEMIVIDGEEDGRDETSVSKRDMQSNIQTLLRKQSRWLAPLLGQTQRDRLVDRWQYKLAHRNIHSQTDTAIRKNVATNTTITHDTFENESTVVGYRNAMMPLRESRSPRRQSSMNELKGMFGELNTLLEECRFMIDRKN